MCPSPCINLCKMDAQSGLCLGCCRTLTEITRWAHIDDAARAAILTAVGQRQRENARQAGKVPGKGDR